MSGPPSHAAAYPDAAPRVARRRVYYISGVDPRGPDFYHQMWRTEARHQASVDGRRYEVGEARDEGDLFTQWTVHASTEDGDTESQHVFMRWEDLMRKHWPRSRLHVLARLPGLYWLYLRSGMLARTWSSARGFFWAYFLMPVIYAALVLLVAGGGGWAAATLASLSGAPPGMQAVLAMGAAAALLWAGLVNAEQIRLFWLCRAHLFMAYWGMRNPQAFAQRWRDFAARIESDLQRDSAGSAPDEILIVAHCGGAPAAVAVAQSWLALQAPGAKPRSPVKILTLGQAIPLLGLMPGAAWFREQLREVGDSSLPWIDYTAPGDLLCYALADSFATCGLPPPRRSDYRVRSARFDKMFAPGEYARLRKDIFRIHFQYLMATQVPVENAFFRLTCGPKPLAAA